MTEETLFL